MIAQDYEYIRQQLITATADLSGSTKGQLVAFAENAQLATNRYKRKRLKVNGRKVPDPRRGDFLPEKGRNVEKTSYWLRRLRDGDVKETSQKKGD